MGLGEDTKKKWAEQEDIMVEEKGDRRLLSHVPNETRKGSKSDRRHDADMKVEDYEDFIAEEKSGIRYITGFSVRLKSCHSAHAGVKCSGKVVDISNSGMLIELDEADYEALEDITNLKVRFRVTPGSMPEGNEMKVKQKVKVVRRFTTDDGRTMCAVTFTKNLHHYAAVNKDRYMFTAATILIAFCVGCILLMRAESIIYFKFNKMLYLYSLVTAVFLLSRYVFGAFYRPKKIDPDFTPGVSILIPCFNEETWIQKTITSCLNQEYPIDKLEVIIIDDHSSDRSVEKIKEIVNKLKKETPEVYKVEERLSYYVQPKNKGKREALVVGAERAKHDLVVFVDSDSFLDPFAIRNIVQPFKDPKMGGVSGRTDVANTYTNALTKMQAVRYYVAFRVMKAAEGLFDAVTCLSGPLSCYRKSIILENKDAWLNQRFLGQKATFGDDRSMTNFILRHHRATYQDTAVCQTIVPNKHKVFLKQQMRWKRSWLRESLIAATFMWKKEPFAAVTFYMGMVVPIAAPIVVIYNLIYVPFTQHIFPTSFLLGLLLMSMLMSLAQLLMRKSSTWIYGMLFCIYYELVLLWQMPIAWFTFWKSTWGTRMTPEDIKAMQRKYRRKLLKKRKYVTPAEFAKVIGITEKEAYTRMEEGRLDEYLVDVNGHRMILVKALDDFWVDTVTPMPSDTDEDIVTEHDTQAVIRYTADDLAAAEAAANAETAKTAASYAAGTTAAAGAFATAVPYVQPPVKGVPQSASYAPAQDDRIKALEDRIDELVRTYREEKELLLEQIRAKDDIIRRKDEQMERLIKGVEIANSNTSRIIELTLEGKR
ncbi:MAG: glycosyltransferase [Lachnospiraceae bacterium]|nr:glycosyltransferase [Lachnospiraceae bacterium]